MGIEDRWLDWWDRLRNGPSTRTSGGVERRDAGNGEATSSTAEGARLLGKLATAPDGELKLAVRSKDPSVRPRGKVRSPGFDPYANDAGHKKPKNWDEVDPR